MTSNEESRILPHGRLQGVVVDRAALECMMLGLRPPGLDDSVFVHPLALVEEPTVGARTRVWPFAHVMLGAKVGTDCNICGHVFVEKGASIGNRVTIKNGVSVWDLVTIEDEVFVGPHAIFTNDFAPRATTPKDQVDWRPTLVRKGATIGAGATIVCGVTIGEYAFVGAGSVVTRDVPPHGQVFGNPARLVGHVCNCLKTRRRLWVADPPVLCDTCKTYAGPRS